MNDTPDYQTRDMPDCETHIPENNKSSQIRMRVPDFEVPKGDIFGNDRLDRRRQIENLTRNLLNMRGPCVLAIDAPWGAGKTAFLKMWAGYLRDEGFGVAEVNAWDTDDCDDPLMALHTELETVFEYQRDGSGKKKALAVSAALVKLSISKMPYVKHAIEAVKATQEAWAEDVQTTAQERLKRHKTHRQARKEFKQALEDAAAGLPHPLVVCVDELDRCRPDYAIRFLEAVKHIFNVEGVVFVLGVNLSELAQSVRVVYGSGFDAKHYLQRFIDWHIPLESRPTREQHAALVNSHLQYANLPSDLKGKNMAPDMFEMFIGQMPDFTARDRLQTTTRHGLFQQQVLNATSDFGSDPSESGYKNRLHMLVTALTILREIVPTEYERFTRSEITDSDVLCALNKRIDRPTDLSSVDWMNAPISFHVSAMFEVMLICWNIYFSHLDASSSIQDSLLMPSSIDIGSESSALWKHHNNIALRKRRNYIEKNYPPQDRYSLQNGQDEHPSHGNQKTQSHLQQDGSHTKDGNKVRGLIYDNLYTAQVFEHSKWFDNIFGNLTHYEWELSELCKQAWHIIHMQD